jgi:hypothetical protein
VGKKGELFARDRGRVFREEFEFVRPLGDVNCTVTVCIVVIRFIMVLSITVTVISSV